ncbi:hypothetical protein EW146_g9255 [Bondarzewia mesenterica]|uniref:Shr3 amino acid permease chaperone n=1 Tax=Bondarzewia mesenterica TaxID=1095465 RepID=A0A4S4L824_9AGAM|nr:hypothetical protein EW146_g9255 [Bondarzewia mesenterica]
MALRVTAIICVTSFLLGLLFTHWIADSLTLWKQPVTDEHLWTAASYYNTLTKISPYTGYFVSSVVALGATVILWSLRDGEAGNLMFDGGSIFLYGTAVVVYLYSVIPNLFHNFLVLPSHALSDSVPLTLRTQILELASSNLICSVALTGVLALQAGRWWAERSDDIDEKEVGDIIEEVKPKSSKSKRKEKDEAKRGRGKR